MTDRYQGKYRSQSTRIADWDYGSPGYYYVTICTKDRQQFFGEVILWNGPVKNNLYVIGPPAWDGMCGGIAGTHQYASSTLGKGTNMPAGAGSNINASLPPGKGTHIDASLPPAAQSAHGDNPHSSRQPAAAVRLTPIGEIAYQNWIDIPKHYPFVVLDEFVIMPDHIHGILCFKKPGYRQRKLNAFGPQSQNLGSVIRGFKGATKSYSAAHNIYFAWQARYHDDVITSGKELDKIRQYIKENPARWIQKNQPTTL